MWWNILAIKLFYILRRFKIKNFKFYFPITYNTSSPTNTNSNNFLGYRLIYNPKRFIFFSHIKSIQQIIKINKDKTTNFKPINFLYRRLHKLSSKKDFIYSLRIYFQKYYYLPNRIPKVSNFFKLFYTWNGKDIAYFFHNTPSLSLIKLGLSLNIQQSYDLLQNSWIYVNGVQLTNKWEVINNNNIIQFFYNVNTLLYVKKLKKIYIKLKRKLLYLHWYQFKQFKKKIKTNFYEKQYMHYIFGVYWVSLQNKCFLTLTFCMWTIPFTYSKWYYFNWLNWLNFNSHTWKYLTNMLGKKLYLLLHTYTNIGKYQKKFFFWVLLVFCVIL